MLIKKIIIILIPLFGFTIFNLGFNELYYEKNFGAVEYKHDLFPEEGEIFDIVVTGNSQPSAGIDFDYVEEINGLNMALGSQSVDYDYEMYKAFEEYMNEDTVVVVTLTFFSFCDRYNGTLFRYDPFLDVQISLEDRIIFNYFPLFGLNRFQTTLRNILNSNNNLNSNELHYNLDFEQWDLEGENRYEGHKTRANCNQEMYEENLQSIENLISENIDAGRDVYILTMPYHETYWGNLLEDEIEYDKFYSRINYLKSKYNINYLDYTIDDRFYNKYEYFKDWDHMNYIGAETFTRILLDDLKLSE